MLRLSLWTLGLALAAPGQTNNPFADSAADIDVGRGTFRIYCSPCHGIDASGGRGPDLTTGVYNAGPADQDLYDVIASGVSGTEMPGYGSRLTEGTIWRIAAYIRSAAKPEPPPTVGDAARGAAIYRGKGACESCHLTGSQGGFLGPELTRVGRARSAEFLRESLTDPNASLTSGYRTVEIVLPDGRKIAGIEETFDNFHVVVMDSSGERHSFSRKELRSAERTGRSAMPSYAEMLSDSERDDVVAYLASLGREETE